MLLRRHRGVYSSLHYARILDLIENKLN